MATQSSIFARKILWTEGPGSLQTWDCKESDTTKASEYSTFGILAPEDIQPRSWYIFHHLCVVSSNAEMVVGCGEYSLGLWF